LAPPFIMSEPELDDLIARLKTTIDLVL
jgi:hypothetical protein